MITLALETSSTVGSVAVREDESTRFAEQFTADRRHSSQLFPVLERALAVAARPDRIVVGLGPGSYSGIRVAISAAIGLHAALGAELLGIPSILALDTDEPEFQIIGDARRSTYYHAHVRSRRWITPPQLFSPEDLPLDISIPQLSTEPLPGFQSVKCCRPCAEILSRMADNDEAITHRGQLEPFYLRDPYITTPRDRPPRL